MQLDHFCSRWSNKLPMKFFAPIMRYEKNMKKDATFGAETTLRINHYWYDNKQRNLIHSNAYRKFPNFYMLYMRRKITSFFIGSQEIVM